MTTSREISVDTEGVAYPSWAIEAVRRGALTALELLAPDVRPERILLTPERAPGELEMELDGWTGTPPAKPAIAFTEGTLLSISYPAVMDAAGDEAPSSLRPILSFAAGSGVGRIAAERGVGSGRLRLQRVVGADMNTDIVAHYTGVAAGGWYNGAPSEAVFFFLNHVCARANAGGYRAVWAGALGWSVRRLAKQVRLGTTPGHFDAAGVPLGRLSDMVALLRYVRREGPWPVPAAFPGADAGN